MILLILGFLLIILIPSTFVCRGEGVETSREFCLFKMTFEFLDCGLDGAEEFMLVLRTFELDFFLSSLFLLCLKC